MTDYQAPIKEIRFALEEIAGLGELGRIAAYEAAEPELVGQALVEAGLLDDSPLLSGNDKPAQ